MGNGGFCRTSSVNGGFSIATFDDAGVWFPELGEG